ncbi:LuxR C-terminal-related transcriptional regulator [Streptomyces sp. NPDC091287]|uniref:LuxR C-terminal-related transcriptional regulator n=1 Tax=Streptomyces sp. NPDC091287 TaxID=3365988 RepID=UPI00380CAE09
MPDVSGGRNGAERGSALRSVASSDSPKGPEEATPRSVRDLLGLVVDGPAGGDESPRETLRRTLEESAAETGRAADRLYEARERLVRLSRRALVSVADRTHGGPAEGVQGRQEVEELLDGLLAGCEQELLALRLGPGPDAAGVNLAPDRLRASLRRGVRITMVGDAVPPGHPARLRRLSRLREEGARVRVRVSETTSLRVAVFDRTTAVLVAAERPEALVLRDAAFSHGLTGLFESCWESALPVPGPASVDRAGPFEARHRAVLRLLACGVKDEAMARRLGISRRTLTRVIAEIMRELGVENRFEAGARAARLGLLGPAPAPRGWSRARG